MNWTTHTDLVILETVYVDDYYRYYGEKFGWEEVTERIVPEQNFECDENGKPIRFYVGGCAYLRTTWRPFDEREESHAGLSRRRCEDPHG